MLDSLYALVCGINTGTWYATLNGTWCEGIRINQAVIDSLYMGAFASHLDDICIICVHMDKKGRTYILEDIKLRRVFSISTPKIFDNSVFTLKSLHFHFDT